MIEKEDKMLGAMFIVSLAGFIGAFSSLLLYGGALGDIRKGALEGYWGTVDSSVDWCEENYVLAPQTAEFHNTISCAITVIAGLMTMLNVFWSRGELRFWFLSGAFPVVGLGSAAFHGSLRRVYQAADEVPMVWMTFFGVYCYVEMRHKRHLRFDSLPPILIMLLTVLTHLNIYSEGPMAVAIFYGSFVPCQLLFLGYSADAMIHTKDRNTKRVYRWSLLHYFIAILSWVTDSLACSVLQNLPMNLPNPQLHAWGWHTFIAFAAYGLIIAPLHERMVLLGYNCTMKFTLFGLLPYCYVTDEKGEEADRHRETKKVTASSTSENGEDTSATAAPPEAKPKRAATPAGRGKSKKNK